MRASGLEPRLTRISNLADNVDQNKRLLEHSRWSGSSSSWRERWTIGKMSSSSSFLDVSRKSKQASKKLYLLALLVFVALVVSFVLARVGGKHEKPPFVRRRINHSGASHAEGKFEHAIARTHLHVLDLIITSVKVHCSCAFDLVKILQTVCRVRQRPNPCSLKAPDFFEDAKDGGEETGGSMKIAHDGSSAPHGVNIIEANDRLQGTSLLEHIRLGKRPSIGLLNIGRDEAFGWQDYAHGRMPVHFPVANINESLQWSDLYPEWIDEEELYESPECPPLPMPCVRKGIKLDLVVAKAPCHRDLQLGGERDIKRLQILLSAASIACQTGHKAMNVLILSECRPLVNLFPCMELLEHQGHAWLYDVNLVKMRKRLVLPVGSCELSLSLFDPGQLMMSKINERRQAYVSMVHTDPAYVCGAIVLAHSIRLSGSTRDLVMLVDANILPEQRKGLEAAGWKVREIERIRNPYAKKDRYNEWNYSKFRLWQLTEYDKVVFIDSDLLVLRNIDFLFKLPEISATGNDEYRFNSGVMVVEPSNCTFNLLMDQIMETRSYNGGDQGYLNEIFPWWHRIPKHVNFLKHFWSNDSEEFETKTQLFAADPPILYVIHYLGMKPWLCYRDYDCNWNIEDQTKYASDPAHATWFKIHDSMPETLRKHCWIRTLFKAAREVERREAEAGKYKDEHWKIKIKDPRLEYCPTPEHCDWEEMILHWNQPPSNNSVLLTP